MLSRRNTSEFFTIRKRNSYTLVFRLFENDFFFFNSKKYTEYIIIFFLFCFFGRLPLTTVSATGSNRHNLHTRIHVYTHYTQHRYMRVSVTNGIPAKSSARRLYCGFVLDQEQGNVVKQCDVQEEEKYTLYHWYTTVIIILYTAVNHTHVFYVSPKRICRRSGFT